MIVWAQLFKSGNWPGGPGIIMCIHRCTLAHAKKALKVFPDRPYVVSLKTKTWNPHQLKMCIQKSVSTTHHLHPCLNSLQINFQLFIAGSGNFVSSVETR